MYQTFSKITIDISVPLAESLPASGRLYWFVRGLDKQGSGNASFRTEDAAELLGVSRSTISRYVSQGQSKGWFTGVICTEGGYRLFYKALPKLAIERGIDNFKVFVREPAVNLRALKFVCVEVAAQSLQAQSHYLAQDERRKQLESKRYQGESELDLFNPSSTISHGENVVHIGKRYAFVTESFMSHGASLDAIATVCGRSRSTVQRRLDNRYRVERGVNPVLKRQLAVKVDDAEYGWMKVNAQKYLFEDCDHELARTFGCHGLYWRASTNLYSLDHELVGKRHLKSKLADYADMGNNKSQNCTR